MIKQFVSIIVPSFHSKDLTKICVNSIKKFCPSNIEIQCIVVENSDDVSYKDEIVSSENVNIKWINNFTNAVASTANAEAIKIGLDHVKSNIVFMLHCDICITSSMFFKKILSKYNEGYMLIGTLYDITPNRINAYHVSGLAVDYKIAKKVKYFPHYENGIIKLDVGDELTQYCKKNNIKRFCFKNTFNDKNLIKYIGQEYADLPYVSRCIDENNSVIFMHLGRGIARTQGKYFKNDRVSIEKWIKFCNGLLS